MESGKEKRLDLRKKFIFTCDPVTARDYDDALSLETDRKGNRVLGVHIADVSYYVKPGSKLDREAYNRGTSVYLPGKVIPMLPEELSNGLCSLVPNEDRLTFSVFMTFDKNGEMIKREFAKSIIRSKARFTYEQVMRLIASPNKTFSLSPFLHGYKISKKDLKTILAINSLAQQLRVKRFAMGALDLALPEVQVLLDDHGNMTGLEAVPYDESHQMIEECMVAANEAVAKELWTKGIKILARFHDVPDEEKLEMLRAELRGLGVKMGNITNLNVFAKFLQAIKKHPLYSTISMLILRSMKKAVYDGEHMGHFGLAKKYYAHFTSPIRRYPDLTLHRQLAAYLEAGRAGRSATAAPGVKIPPRRLASWAKHLSEKEQEAEQAERDAIEEKKYEYLEAEINSRCLVEYEAIITKCMPFGAFVEIPTLAISGLVHVSQLGPRNSFVKFNQYDQTLSAAGCSWRVGDKLEVIVGRVDFHERKIDFIPVRDQGKGKGYPHGKRGRAGSPRTPPKRSAERNIHNGTLTAHQ